MKKRSFLLASGLIVAFVFSTNSIKAAEPEQIITKQPHNTVLSHSQDEDLTISFDLSNPSAQTNSFYDEEGNLITISMSEELSVKKNTREFVPVGSFDRIFSLNNGLTYMSARFKGTVNPYISKFTSISNGTFRSSLGSWIKERYGTSTLIGDPNVAVGLYQVFYSDILIGGTRTMTLEVYLYRGTAFGEAVIKITPEW